MSAALLVDADIAALKPMCSRSSGSKAATANKGFAIYAPAACT
jgi:hypothetical protein